MALSYNIYGDVLPKTPWYFGLYVLFFIACLGLYLHARRADNQNKHQDYRALAEGLRVQLFWRLAGLPDSVADHYLRKQRSELTWIRNAIQVWRISADHACAVGPVGGVQQTDRMKQLLEHWVEEQRRYFADRARKDERKLEHLERFVRALVALSLALALALAAAFLARSWWGHALHLAERWVSLADHEPGCVVLLITMFSVSAALVRSYIETMALSEHTRQYERMSLLFENAAQRLEEAVAAGNHEEARHLVRELGKEALAENGDWLLLHRQRPLDVPGG